MHEDQPVKYNVTHHITINGPPVDVRARCLVPERSCNEFDHTLRLYMTRIKCLVHLCNMVPKKTPRDRCPCGDYSSLNNATIYDRTLFHPRCPCGDYSSLNNATIYDRTLFHPGHCSHAISIWSRLQSFLSWDLVRAYNPITPFGLFEIVRIYRWFAKRC